MFSILEALAIIVIIIIQMLVARHAFKQIRQTRRFLPGGRRSLTLKEYEIPAEQIRQLEPSQIIGQEVYFPEGDHHKVKVHLICLDNQTRNPLIIKVIDTINSYLLKNKGGVSDFNLMKDIVERNCDAIDEEINQQLPIPIYLGLMGTILGIILGLWSIHFDPQNFMESVTDLIESVKLAMVCSFMGLLLTTILSAKSYRGAKAKLEEQKNELFTFIQIELLPRLTMDANSSIVAMQAHIEKFNHDFADNVTNFDGIMVRILSVFDDQVQLQEELKELDIKQLAALNTNTLAELRKSMTEFEKFNQYLNLMNSFVQKTAQITDSVNDQLRRTDDIKHVISSMEENIENNRLVMEKLQNFLQKVEAHNALITATASLDDTLTDAIDQLRKHVQEEINAIKVHTSQASLDLNQLLISEKGNLEKLKNLDSLSNLQQLVQSVTAMKESYDLQSYALSDQVGNLAHAISEMKNDNKVTITLGLSPMVLRIVSFLIGLAAILFISSRIYQMYEDYAASLEPHKKHVTEYIDDTAGLVVDSISVEKP